MPPSCLRNFRLGTRRLACPGKRRKKTSTRRLTGQWGLVDIPGLTEENQTEWKIQCLGLKTSNGDTVSKAYDELDRWRKEEKTEFRKLFRSIQYAGTNKIHINQDRIRQDKRKRGGFEIKSTSCKCRLMFFYHKELKTLICTNTFWKERNSKNKDQDTAFKRCAYLKEKYLTSISQDQ